MQAHRSILVAIEDKRNYNNLISTQGRSDSHKGMSVAGDGMRTIREASTLTPL